MLALLVICSAFCLLGMCLQTEIFARHPLAENFGGTGVFLDRLYFENEAFTFTQDTYVFCFGQRHGRPHWAAFIG